jgi:hypothetical protein
MLLGRWAGFNLAGWPVILGYQQMDDLEQLFSGYINSGGSKKEGFIRDFSESMIGQ